MSKLLVVDDEEMIRKRLQDLLSLSGHELVVADSGRRALDQLGAHADIDLVITDIKMPGMDGIALLKQVKTTGRETEVIMITGHGGIETAIEALRAGAFDYITKPLDFDELEIAVDRALERQQMRRQIAQSMRDLEQKNQELAAAYGDLRAAQQQLVQSAKMSSLGQLAAGVCHELYQPMTMIKGYAEEISKDLSRDEIEREEVVSSCDVIIDSVQRMGKIIEHMRLFARQAPAEPELVDINQVVEDSLVLLRAQLTGRAIAVVLETEHAPAPILGNPNRLQQVFVNLLVNARDAMPQGGRISIRTAAGHDFVEARVADTGCGISAELRQKIFDPFFTTKDPDKGTGLGLSIIYGIMEDHHGKIEVDSEVGQGTTFILRWPRAR